MIKHRPESGGRENRRTSRTRHRMGFVKKGLGWEPTTSSGYGVWICLQNVQGCKSMY